MLPVFPDRCLEYITYVLSMSLDPHDMPLPFDELGSMIYRDGKPNGGHSLSYMREYVCMHMYMYIQR